jgi:hypothetical protein
MGGIFGAMPQVAWTLIDPRLNLPDASELPSGSYLPYAPPPVAPLGVKPAPHPRFFAHDGLGMRLLDGLGAFATQYLALGGNPAAQDELERRAEHAARLRAQALQQSHGPVPDDQAPSSTEASQPDPPDPSDGLDLELLNGRHGFALPTFDPGFRYVPAPRRRANG